MNAARHVGGALVMVAGCGLVLWLLLAMNRPVPPPEPARVSKQVSFEAKTPPKKKRPPKKRRQRKRPTPARRAGPPPPPIVGAGLSAVSLDVPMVDIGGVGSEAEALLGGAAAAADLVMTEDTVDSVPTPLRAEPPEYPRAAVRRGLTGKVVLSVDISAAGEVVRVRVVDADPPGVFDQSAVGAVRRTRWQPAVYRGQPVAIEAFEVVYDFDLT
jgi:protein TonB